MNRSFSVPRVSAFFISLFLAAAAVAAPVRLSTISVSPGAVLGGNTATGTATLTAAAGHGGVVVTLSSSNTAVATVPASVSVPQGATSATFTVSTSPVNAATNVTITGNYSVNATASFTVSRPSVNSLSITPGSFIAGSGSATGSVWLDGRAGSNGVVVTLTHTGTFVTMPASVTIPAGETGTAFGITSSPVSSTTTVTVTASANGNTAVATVDVSPCTMQAMAGTTIVGSNADIVWFDDTLPAGMSLGTAQWNTTNYASGSQSLTTSGGTGYQSFQLTGATAPFTLYGGEQMYFYVLTNPCTPPREIMVGFHTTTGVWKKAYVGSALIGGESNAYNAGATPYPGYWTTLAVSAQQLGLPNGAQLDGFSLELSDGQAWVDRIEKACHQPTAAAPSLPATGDTYWIDDTFTSGQPGGGYLTRWDTTQHASGTQALLQYATVDNASFQVNIGDTLIAYVLLDYCWPGQEIDIRYITSYQEAKGFYWGASTWNNAGFTYMGPLPTPGQWVRLEIPAASFGLEDRWITSIGAYGNGWWDLIGKSGQGCSFPTAAAPSIPAGDTLLQEDGLNGNQLNGAIWTPDQHASGTSSLTLPYAGPGDHWIAVTNASPPIHPTFGENLVFYALLDPCAPPSELAVQWNNNLAPITGMYWGTPHGFENGFIYMGALPAAGVWTRFEVPAVTVNAQGQTIYSIKFEWQDGNAFFDHIGKGGTACYTAAAAQPTNFSGSDVTWIDDALPYGAGYSYIGWDASQKASGTQSMAQSYASGLHDMGVTFMNGAGYPIASGDTLTFYVLLDECAPPTEVMLRWLTSGGVTKGAYWGTPHNLGEGDSSVSMGALPPAGVWTRIDIPASQLDLESTTIQGLDLISYDGHTFFDRIGKSH